MTLFTQADRDILDRLRFIEHHDDPANRWQYVAEGKHVYQTMSNSGIQVLPGQMVIQVLPGQMVIALSTRVQTCPIFVKKLRHDRRFASSSVYGYWAAPLARYMLDNDWMDFIKPKEGTMSAEKQHISLREFSQKADAFVAQMTRPLEHYDEEDKAIIAQESADVRGVYARVFVELMRHHYIIDDQD
ncbi:hypothetical protein EVC45_10215 [Paraburkholderia sp. UYCP14C]|uniref:hypothetical protein n=1 Tax=Paraburkholderia sp. UYCP14C TaxID=2511130 RepID=UPI0010222238|nr:hypothetical protein [Paraburkholderia sp. UYCP14C]RZF29963.1 hypothetical protein EVC45_10215 [Paraburkholderia sp. UYCP14C]